MATPKNNLLKHFINSEVWDTKLTLKKLDEIGVTCSKRTAERRMHELGLWPEEINTKNIRDELNRPLNSLILEKQIELIRSKRKIILFLQLQRLNANTSVVVANGTKGSRYWVSIKGKVNDQKIVTSINKIVDLINKSVVIFPHGQIVSYFRSCPKLLTHNALTAYREYSDLGNPIHGTRKTKIMPHHLERLEAESIFIFREAVAQSKNPGMLYSIGKDSSVMLELAKKAFYPGKIPFPLIHVDTRWKFQAMYEMRNKISQESNIELIVHINPEAIAKNINPFEHGATVHTDITKTEGLKQALDKHNFDLVFGGARRDEEKSRAKERIFSFRTSTHYWDPKNQRPELWHLFNARTNPGENIRVFPLSNWTELDVWEYILYQDISVVPLYFAKKRPIVKRNNLLIMVDDERFNIGPNEKIIDEIVRFRTLGCYPLTGAVKSDATNVIEIIQELRDSKQSERQGRIIDSDPSASMEKKKQEGYF